MVIVRATMVVATPADNMEDYKDTATLARVVAGTGVTAVAALKPTMVLIVVTLVPEVTLMIGLKVMLMMSRFRV